MKIIRSFFVLFLTCGSAAFAQPIVLADGAYQLIRAETPGEGGEERLSAVLVDISHKDGKAFISFDGATKTEIRTDDQQGFLVALPYHPGEKGALASEIVFAGKQRDFPPLPSGSPAARIEGKYRIISSYGEGTGAFALYPVPSKSG